MHGICLSVVRFYFRGMVRVAIALLALFWAAEPAFAQPVCPALEGDGIPSSPYQVVTLCQLQGIRSNLTAHYALAAHIDASPTRTITWNGGAGFDPIGSVSDPFSGSFVNSNDYVITGLTIDRPEISNVGMFSVLAIAATIRGVILMDARTTGKNSVGSLVGRSNGTILDSSATGSVSGNENVGGLVGRNDGTISGSFVTGTVKGNDNVGGLVGYSAGFVSNNYATGAVSGNMQTAGLVGHNDGTISNNFATGSVKGPYDTGGLVGFNNQGSVRDSYATGSVSGNDNVGGLVGGNTGTISNSYATGPVSGNNRVGGLVGVNSSSIIASYATGTVTGTLAQGNGFVGGLVGLNDNAGHVSRSSATGTVKGNDDVGGLVGRNLGTISNGFATGSVSGNTQTGGLVGHNEGTINNNFATGSVKGPYDTGGLVGYNNQGSVRDSYATGSVSGNVHIGGLVGGNTGTISNGFATGSVKGNDGVVGGLVAVNAGGNVSRSYYARGPNNNLGEPRSIEQMRCPTMASVPCMNVVTYNGWDTDVWNFGSETELPQLKNNPNSDLNRKPYIGGLGERTVRVAPETGSTTLAFEAVDAASAGVNATLTWSLSGLPPALKGFAYFDSVNGMTATASGSSARLTIMPGAWGTEGTFFDVVLMNSVSGDSDRVRVRVVEAQPPEIDGAEGNVLNQDVRESASTALLTFTANVGVPGDHSRLQWEFLVDGEPTTSVGDLIQFDGSTQGASVSVRLERPGGRGDFGSFVLRVTDPVGPSSTFTVNIVAVCAGNGKDLMTRQTGIGSASTPYRIWTLCQLQDVRSTLTAHYALAAHIDASPTVDWNGGAGFDPIGSLEDLFFGSFVNNGNHVITGLTINRPVTGYVGLFSHLVSGAMIRGVILMDARMTGHSYVGSLVGHSLGTIEDSSATGSVSGNGYIGGLVGRNFGTISNSFATGSVSGQTYIGGLVGRNHGTISNSFATGSVSGNRQTGGLVGRNLGTISNSFATGSVSGNRFIGGLVGINTETISNSFATGSVSGNTQTGGLVGLNFATISNSYATGSVSGNVLTGGLVGDNIGGNVSRSYYARGANNSLGEPRSIEQMRCPTMASVLCMDVVTYNGWNTDVWNFGSETELPQLKNNPNPDLNRKPYIGGLGERMVRVAPETGSTTLAFEAVDAASAGVNATLTWSLSGLPPALKGLAYFDSVNGTTATASGSSARLTIMPGAWGTGGTFFDVVLMNSVSADSDRVRVRVVEAQPPEIDGAEGNVLNQDVRESASTALLTFTADVTVPGDHSRLEWRFLVDGDPMISIGSFAKFVGPLGAASQGTSVSVLLTRSGNYDVGSFVLRVTDPLGPSSTFTVNIVPVCAGNGKDLMTRQTGIGSASTPYRIWTLCQLQDVRSSPRAYYELAADIDARFANTLNDGTGFAPISFSGSFVNSNDYVITGLTIDRPEIGNVGMFSVLAIGATIRGVILMDARTTGNRYVGSLVGYSLGTIEDSSATGSVSGNEYVGGLVGFNSGTISNSYATGSVSGQAYIGGLVGDNEGSISNSYATGSVKGNIVIGGLVGSNNRGTINNSFATGSVSGNDDVGGLVGSNFQGSVRDSYATGSVKGNVHIGGLVGGNRGTISDGFATGSVSGNDDVGGLVGFNSGGNVSRSYYYARGANNNLEEPRSIEQMRCPTMASVSCMNAVTYNGWNTDVWNFGSKTELPQLKNNPNSDLNRKPYIGGLGERMVRVAPETGSTTLAFEAVDAASTGVNATLTWSLSGLPPALKGFAYFDSVNGMTATASGSSARLTIMPGAWGTEEGTFFDVVLMNSVSADSDRVRVWVVEAQPPVIVGLEGNVLNQDVKESASTALLTFTANVGVPGDHSRLQWEFLVDGEPMISIGSFAKFVGPLGAESQGTSVSVLLTRSGNYDVGSFVLRVTDPLGPSSTFTVNIVPVCAGNGEDLMDRQTGIGSASTPYRIWTLCQLQDVRSSPRAYYELAADIDARFANTLNDGTGFAPISIDAENGFSGSFVNSSNYVITALTINRPSTNYVGLFSRLAKGATLRGVILMDARTTGLNNVGSLVGRSNGTILDSSATGIVSGDSRVGGLVGLNDDAGRVSRSSATGTVSGNEHVGGLVGQNQGGTIEDSRSLGSVTGDSRVGGLVGENTGSIIASYATGTVTGTLAQENGFVGGLVGNSLGNISGSHATGKVVGAGSRVGGLVGQNQGGTIEDSRSLGSVTGGSRVGGLVGENTSSIIASYATGTVTGTLAQENGFVGGLVGLHSSGVISGSYAIGKVDGRGSRVGGLVGYSAGFVSNNYATGAVSGNENVGGLVGLNDDAGRVSRSSATGTVSGNEHVGGLVGRNQGGTIKDTRSLGSVTGDSRVGGLVGENVGSIIASYATGTVTGTLAQENGFVGGLVGYSLGNISGSHATGKVVGAGSRVGGLVGQNQGGTIEDSRSLGSVTGGSRVGGLVGENTSSIIASYATGTVTGTLAQENGFVGGLVGLHSSGVISGSYAIGKVDGRGSRVGGLVGYSAGFVSNNYATGAVSGNENVGGLVGLNDDAGRVSRSSATGTVKGNDDVGGLVGRNLGTISNGFATGSVSGNTQTGGLVGHNEGTINNNFATGSVKGPYDTGGLVGFNNQGSVRDSYATGSVSGNDNVGGLVGGNTGTISNGFATGSVSGNTQTGGLVGHNEGTINNNFATGSVKGPYDTGGLVGFNNQGSVRDSYATGSVSGNDNVGGLVGGNTGTISNGFATGSVKGNDGVVGGLVAVNVGGNVSRSYYARGPNNNLGEPRSIEQMRCPTMASVPCMMNVVTYNGWDTDVWNFGSETELPQLKNNPNSDLNRKPYIGGLGERTVRVAPETGNTTLAFEAVDAASAGVNATLTWSLSGLPPALKGLAYFDSVNGMTATASGSSARLTIMPGAWGTEGTFFDVVLMNSVSGDSDRVRVRVVEASLQLRIRVYLGGATR